MSLRQDATKKFEVIFEEKWGNRFESTIFVFLFALVFSLGFIGQSLAAPAPAMDILVEGLIRNDLAQRCQNAKIQFHGNLKWISGATPEKIESVVYQGEPQPGVARYRANQSIVEANYSAWLVVPVAVRTIRPMEKLEENLFRFQEIDLSKGMARENRGLILEAFSQYRLLEARHTIPAGTYALKSAVQESPLVRRGDLVKVYIRSRDLTITTVGRAQEPGSAGTMIRVMTESYKKDLQGKVLQTGSVEVTL